MLKRFLSYYRPHKFIFMMDLIAAGLFAAVGVVYPILTRSMLNDYIPQRKYGIIIAAGIGMFAMYILRFGLKYFMMYYGHLVGVHMQSAMRQDLFSHLQKLPFSFFDEHETGKIMSRMTNDLFEIAELAHHGPENIIISLLSLLVAFIYLGSINMRLTVIIFVCVPVLLTITYKIRGRVQLAYKKCKEMIAGVNASVENSVSGIRVTKAFTNAEKEQEKFRISDAKFVEASKERYKAMALFLSTTGFVMDVFNVVVLLAGGLFLFAGNIDYADYSAFIVSINLFVNPVNTLLNFMEQFQSGVTGFERFIEIMDVEPEIEKDTAVDVRRLSGHIELRNVSYSYEEGNEVLDGISMDIQPGKTYALVGPSGGGKTTICHLIPHFYDVREGSIFLDGMEIHDIKLTSLRKNIGIVQQDIYLFNASVKDNILYGRLDATDDEVIEAAKRANIHDYIMQMPQGYDTVIGERGVKLSGGQKQRLSIARVFLKNPPILILDEATSALDNTTEILIQKSLDELSRGRTTIVVAHRLSTIRNADVISVISEGKIAEQGSHNELINAGGMYEQLYKLQFRDE